MRLKSVLLMFSIFTVGSLSSANYDPRDSRQAKANHKLAKEAAQYIYKENKSHPDISKKALAELKEICTNSLHEGCFFQKTGGKIYFTKLKDKKTGGLTRETHEIKSWLKELFK